MTESTSSRSIRKRKIAVVAPEKRLRSSISQFRDITTVDSLTNNQILKWSDIFVFVSMPALREVSDLIRSANNTKRLKGVFVSIDSVAQKDIFLQYLSHFGFRALRNMVVYSGSEIPKRVLNAFSIGAENELIAYAVTIDNDIFVTNCALKSFQLSFDSIRALRNRSNKEKQTFCIADDGSYLHWPAGDIHLNLDSIRSILDPAFRAQRTAEKLESYASVGDAVKHLRLECELRQSDIPEISERQIRRIEKGDRLTLSCATKLAAAHGMDVNVYLNGVAMLSSENSDR